MLRIEFVELPSIEAAKKRFATRGPDTWDAFSFPITAVEVYATDVRNDVAFGLRATRLPGGNRIIGGVVIDDCDVAVQIGERGTR